MEEARRAGGTDDEIRQAGERAAQVKGGRGDVKEKQAGFSEDLCDNLAHAFPDLVVPVDDPCVNRSSMELKAPTLSTFSNLPHYPPPTSSQDYRNESDLLRRNKTAKGDALTRFYELAHSIQEDVVRAPVYLRPPNVSRSDAADDDSVDNSVEYSCNSYLGFSHCHPLKSLCVVI